MKRFDLKPIRRQAAQCQKRFSGEDATTFRRARGIVGDWVDSKPYSKDHAPTPVETCAHVLIQMMRATGGQPVVSPMNPERTA